MKKSTINLFAIIILLLFSFTTKGFSSTSKSYDGYVFLETGEKVFGKIHMFSIIENQLKLKITLLDKETERTYKSQDVKSYAFQVKLWDKETKQYQNEWITYAKKRVERAALPFGKRNILINQLIDGKISYYTYYYQCNADVSEPIKQAYYIEKSNSFVVINASNYADILREMTYDYPELSSEIGQKDFKYRHIEKMITLYNDYILGFGEEESITQRN